MWQDEPGGVRRRWKPLYRTRRITSLSMRPAAEPSEPSGPGAGADQDARDGTAASCDYCGSARLEWRKCKLVCSDCKQINKSCADL